MKIKIKQWKIFAKNCKVCGKKINKQHKFQLLGIGRWREIMFTIGITLLIYKDFFELCD